METTMIISGSAEEISAVVELLAGLGQISITWGPEALPPLVGWERLPEQDRPTPVEQAIIQRDLRGDARRKIAGELQLTPGTITVYRRNIRRKLLRTPHAQLPQWALSWLWRFPGER